MNFLKSLLFPRAIHHLFSFVVLSFSLGAYTNCVHAQESNLTPVLDWAQPQTSSLISELQSPVWLAKCEIVAPAKYAGKRRLLSKTVLKIIHVYAGPTELEGKVFDTTENYFLPEKSLEAEMDTAPQQAIMPVYWFIKSSYPASGPNYWSLDIYNPQSHFKSKRTAFYPQVFRPVWTHGADQQASEEHATRVEEVCNADLPHQQHLLIQYAKNQTPLTSAWAIRCVASWKNDMSLQLLWEIAASEVIEKQDYFKLRALDETLKALDEKDWIHSPTRDALLRLTVSLPLSPIEIADFIATPPSSIGKKDYALERERDGDGKSLRDNSAYAAFTMELLRSVARNRSFQSEYLASYDAISGMLENSYQESILTRDDILQVLLDILKDSQCDGISQYMAAELISWCNLLKSKPLTLHQWLEIYSLRRSLESRLPFAPPPIADILREAIEQMRPNIHKS